MSFTITIMNNNCERHIVNDNCKRYIMNDTSTFCTAKFLKDVIWRTIANDTLWMTIMNITLWMIIMNDTFWTTWNRFAINQTAYLFKLLQLLWCTLRRNWSGEFKLPSLSRNCHFEHINRLQCYELARRCSHLLLFTDFTIDLCCAQLVFTLWMCNEAELTTNF